MATAALEAAIAARDTEAARDLVIGVLHDAGDFTVAFPAALEAPATSTAPEFVVAIKALVASVKAAQGTAALKGQPAVLLVIPSAPRAAALCGLLRRKGVQVAKLFARHLDLAEQASFLRLNRVDVGVGTPGRLGRLLTDDALDLGALRHVLLDVTADAKEMCFFSTVGKGQARRPDADELSAMLRAGSFPAALGAPKLKRRAVLTPVMLPDQRAIEDATPATQLMGGRGNKGRGRGGRARGSARGGFAGRGGRTAPRASAFEKRGAIGKQR